MLGGCGGPLAIVAQEDTEKLPRANCLAQPGLTASSLREARRKVMEYDS